MTELDASSIARRLDRNDVQASNDALLAFLADISQAGIPVGIALIVDGLLLTGAITPVERFVESLDGAMQEAVEVLGKNLSAEALKVLDHPFSGVLGNIKKREKRERAVVEKYLKDVEVDGLPTIDDLQLEEVSDFYRGVSSSTHIELSEARLLVNGDFIQIGTMRVAVSHVAAWWPLREQEGAKVIYHPGTRAEHPAIA